ncbi:MAG: PepSY domain-containing protein [Porticoccaceae bacterium]|nr:PepSY domain-containing protein [Porticoccaceae bacterium]
MNQRRNKRNKSKSLYVWHRYAGLFAALFVIFLSITGIALNHTDDLALKKSHVSSNILLAQYNVQAPTNIIQFNVGPRVITQADDFLFIDTGSAIHIEAPIVGAAKFAEFLIIALSDALLLIDASNQLVETLSAIDGIPNDINSIGAGNNGQVSILAGERTYTLNSDLLLQTSIRNNNINWSTPKVVSSPVKADIVQRYKSNIISVEILLLDIHSGRFFGAYGALFFDFVGIVLLFLASTGVIIWLKQRPNKKHND